MSGNRWMESFVATLIVVTLFIATLLTVLIWAIEKREDQDSVRRFYFPPETHSVSPEEFAVALERWHGALIFVPKESADGTIEVEGIALVRAWPGDEIVTVGR